MGVPTFRSDVHKLNTANVQSMNKDYG